MINFDPNLETRVVKTVLETRSPKLLTALTPDYFGFPVAREIWLRIASLRQNGKTIPSALTMSGDSVLSENAQTLLKGDVAPFSDDELDHAIEQLNFYRQGRVILEMNQKILEIMKEPMPDLSGARFQIEKGLSGLQNSKTEDETLTYGYDNDTTLDRYEFMMSKNVDDLFVPTGFYSIDSQQGGLGRGKLYAIGAKSGGGKCFAKGTPILLFSGKIKSVEELEVGDELMGPDSKPRKITGLARGQEEMFEVIPVKGNPFTVNRSHILSLQRVKDKEIETINLSVGEYLEKNQSFKNTFKLYRSGVVSFPQKKTSIPPYILGVYLGDGSRHNKKITTNNPAIINQLKDFADSIGAELTSRISRTSFAHYITFGRRGGRDIKNPVLEEFKKCVEGEDKRIPEEYLINSEENRLELLAGLLDTDGHLHHNFYEVVTKFEPLKEGILFLARSLGFAAYAKEKTVMTQKGLIKYYRINISGEVHKIPIRTEHKKGQERKQVKSVLRTGFSLVSKGVGDYYGFEVEGPDRLFLLGDFTVTHNSTLANQICINAYLKGFSSNYNSFEMGWEECMIRTQAAISRIPANRFNLKSYTETDKAKSDRVLAEFLSLGETTGKRLQYNCPGGRKLNLAQLFAEIEHLKFDLVVVDYINLLEYINPKESMWWNLGEAFRLAKQFAERTKSVVIMLVQIDEDTGKIKYAQSIKHHSDGVWIWDWNEQTEETGVVEVEQIKLRNFKPTKFNLRAEFEYCSFTDTNGPNMATSPPKPKNTVTPVQPMEFS